MLNTLKNSVGGRWYIRFARVLLLRIYIKSLQKIWKQRYSGYRLETRKPKWKQRVKGVVQEENEKKFKVKKVKDNQ